MQYKRFLVTAAGGNGTAIQILDHGLSRQDYQARGPELEKEFGADGAEQWGFLIPSENHFEMSGGEFCGNASRAAAMLLSELTGKDSLSFTVSGFDGTVAATVDKRDDRVSIVRCVFPDLPTAVTQVMLASGQSATIVDLGGIVHVVIEGAFPEKDDAYKAAHQSIVKELGLSDRPAVGVVWYERSGDDIRIHPVVWVRQIDTFFYETSCGSGTIAVGKVTGATSIVQPSGKRIDTRITDGKVALESEMEVTRAS